MRFWSKVDKRGPDECWPWIAGVHKKTGYGNFWLDGKTLLAHRASFFLTHGHWPVQACQSCGNPPCVNPAHLFDGNQSQNIADSVAKGRWPRGDRHYSRTFPETLARGKRGGKVKLNTSKVLAIRASHLSQRALARKFRVSPATVHCVITRKTWGHV